jgi:DMSO/TMAO reductase YedYZ molybdopterin-dependent catalytic subunit
MNRQSPLRPRALVALTALAAGLVLARSPSLRAEVAAARAEVAALTVRGDVEKPGTLTLAELTAMEATTAPYTAHEHTQTVVGVPLAKVLLRYGVVPGPMGKTMAPADKRAGYKKVIVASAADGFQAVFSLAELSEGMGKTQALLVWKADGKPLAPEQGPLRLVVLSDGEPSRSVHQVRTLDVVDMRRIVPPAGKPAH